MTKEEKEIMFPDWTKSPEEIEKMCDEEAKSFYRDFVPLYMKYRGTRQLRKHLAEYIKTHEIKRKDDFRFTLIGMWIDHIYLYRLNQGKEFKAEDCFRVKIPMMILNIIDEPEKLKELGVLPKRKDYDE